MRWLALALVALTLAACGSSGSSEQGSTAAPAKTSSGPSDKLSKAELIAKADKICQDVNKRFQEIPRYKSLLTDYRGVERFGEEAASLSDEAVRRLRDLTPPDSVKSDYTAFVKDIDGQAKVFRRLADAAKAKSSDEIVAARTDRRTLNRKAPMLARRIGFKVCGRGS